MTPERYEQAMMWAGVAPAGIIAGQTAKTANFVRLAKAKEMAKAKAPREAIWRDTGWYQGPEGKCKFEIPDDAARLHPLVESGNVKTWGGKDTIDVEELLQHPELYRAYPDIARTKTYGNVRSALDDVGDAISGKTRSGPVGGYSPESGIGLDVPLSGDRSTSLHELQHAVQRAEGFARGGNAKEFTSGYKNALRDLNDQIDAINSQLAKAIGTPKYDELLDLRSYLVKEIHKIEGPHGIGAQEKGFDMYKRLAGEAEARAVQSRMAMTPAERMAKPPWESYDVPWDQ